MKYTYKQKRGLWFKVMAKDNKIYVDKTSDYTPSSKLSVPRPLSKKEFLAVYPFYERWANNEKGISNKMCEVSKNTVYILALIKHFINL
jgi:hypothetical protein